MTISYILPGPVAQLVRSLMPGMIVAEVNDVPVYTIEEFRKALMTSAKTGFLTIKTIEQIMAAFAIDAVLADEQRLADSFDYELSETIVALMEKRK